MAHEKLQGLIAAFSAPFDPEAPKNPFSPDQWAELAGYLTPVALLEPELLFQRKREERSLYFIERGRVTIHYENAKGAVRMALVSSGAVFGEASFLGNLPRQATAQVASAGQAWVLGRMKFNELHKRNPDLALDVAQLAATTLARRSRDPRRRRAIA